MKIITLVVSFALFAFSAPALRASGITVEKWKYDPETKILSVKLVNTSGKIITALGLSIRREQSPRLFGKPDKFLPVPGWPISRQNRNRRSELS